MAKKKLEWTGRAGAWMTWYRDRRGRLRFAHVRQVPGDGWILRIMDGTFRKLREEAARPTLDECRASVARRTA